MPQLKETKPEIKSSLPRKGGRPGKNHRRIAGSPMQGLDRQDSADDLYLKDDTTNLKTR